jgi:hypothetical protein
VEDRGKQMGNWVEYDGTLPIPRLYRILLYDWNIGMIIYIYDDYSIGIWYIGMIIIYQYCNIQSKNIPI